MHGAPGFDASRRAPGRRVAGRAPAPELGDPGRLCRRCAGGRASLPPPDFNTGNNEGVGYFEVNQRRGVRWNAAKAFIRPARQRSNLEVRTGWQTARLLLGDGVSAPLHAHGVEALPPGGCAGADVALPARSDPVRRSHRHAADPATFGHRPRWTCCAPRASSPGWTTPASVKTCRTTFRSAPSSASKGVKDAQHHWANSAWGKALIGLEYALLRSGPMSMSPSQLGAFTRSSQRYRWPNVQYHVQPLSLDAFGEPLHRFNAFTASVCNLNPTVARPRAGALITARGRAAHHGQLPVDAGRPPRGGRFAATHAAHRLDAGAGALPAAGDQARQRSSRARTSWRGWQATSAPPSSTRWAPAAWGAATTRWPWSIRGFACWASAACGLSTPA